MTDKKYVPNEVYKFRCTLKHNLCNADETVYIKPLPEHLIDNLSLDECEDLVMKKYFTQQKIDELKLKLVQKIQESKNPFNIHCIDVDGGYNVTEDELFNLNIL